MKTNDSTKVEKQASKDTREDALHYMKTLVDVSRESFLILDSDLKVISGNQVFYDNFKVAPEDTVNKFIYDLGNGQWDIPELKKLLEHILPSKKTVRDYEVEHIFPTIGEKTMRLNARQIDSVQLIILAIEDITEKFQLEKKVAEYTKDLEVKVAERTAELATRLQELEKLNKSMVGRELKMVELKKENADLKKKAGI
ncbi:MAG: PAS domain-containing protein [Candidatus Taylorbacteria bacterium]